MELQDVRYETDGAVALVTLARARYRNAQSWRLLDELDLALERAQNDRAVRMVVVRGEGPWVEVELRFPPTDIEAFMEILRPLGR